MRGVLQWILRRLNQFRASSNERRLDRELRSTQQKLDEVRADAERRIAEAEAVTLDAIRRTEVAEARADMAQTEKEIMSKALERVRAHYEADIAEAAKRIAAN